MSSSLASQLALAAAAAPGVRAGTASAPTKGRPSLLFHAREAEDVDARTVLALARSGALSRARACCRVFLPGTSGMCCMGALAVHFSRVRLWASHSFRGPGLEELASVDAANFGGAAAVVSGGDAGAAAGAPEWVSLFDDAVSTFTSTITTFTYTNTCIRTHTHTHTHTTHALTHTHTRTHTHACVYL